MKLTFLSFRAINAPMDAAALMRQMDEMQALGLDVVVFHPRYYPDQPPYLSKPYMDILSRVILHARDTGMLFWIYDENGWPSGTAGGPDDAPENTHVTAWHFVDYFCFGQVHLLPWPVRRDET